ncbi:hypothetical protein SDRG_09614 [Saprolegnia diclina VS20]|uniref:Uncharacterized protein n=1 Tax=Saprolegnia diclina (strain VS20) TaxID=1156394 RepID=T0RK26_SAPDV|nr:hypothetical protein SDRG_09614 [Saprolegnia diclina VS20]EQC32638.1 hypothetical protein SDRG_09614 [Saprolegnia diclina VS20]|eukprot:XP_008613782.1 hypothetical protein SDRG_09614 [Saprolegnia diclina VS20]
MLVFWFIMAILWASLFDVLPSGFYDKFPIDTTDATEETAFAEQHRLACDRRAATANVFYYFVPLLTCALVFEYVRLHAVLHSMLLLLTFLLALMFLRYVITGRILEHKQNEWTLWGLEATASTIQDRTRYTLPKPPPRPR